MSENLQSRLTGIEPDGEDVKQAVVLNRKSHGLVEDSKTVAP